MLVLLSSFTQNKVVFYNPYNKMWLSWFAESFKCIKMYVIHGAGSKIIYLSPQTNGQLFSETRSHEASH